MNQTGYPLTRTFIPQRSQFVISCNESPHRPSYFRRRYPCSYGNNGASRVTRDETLGDRIGERMRSRLAEMCVTVSMTGQDFRQGVGRARFG